jgi:N6-adenosine-specific RNA methylase IME4
MNLPNKKYKIIYADPPWYYHNYADKTATRWVGNKYPVMSVDDICNLPVSGIADDDSILFLWATPPCLPEALKVITAWGFDYKTIGFVWVKKNKVADSLFWGMGYWTRSNSEICLIATKGTPKRINASVHQIVEAPVGEHSRKPDIVRKKIVDLVGDLDRIELFARKREDMKYTDGWIFWGNEV